MHKNRSFFLLTFIVQYPNMTNEFLMYGLMIAIAILLVWVVRLEMRLSRLMRGGAGKSLEEHILFAKKGVEELGAARREIEDYLVHLHNRLKKSLSRVETMRFNPFKGDGSGGNQSFVTALLDEDGNGVVLSGLYSREKVNVYAKPVKNFISEIQLSDEEQEVLEKVKK